jgi:Hypervirulence associated proteins TUDOR domain
VHFFVAKELKPGDRVQWNTPQGKTTGTVKKKLTPPENQRTSRQSTKENPEYLVQSERSGKEAAHKPGELHKARTRRESS